MRLLAIGDIHGCLQTLEGLIDQVQPTKKDQVIFLGDYIDQGPSSKGVIDYLIKFGRRFPQTVFLRGNHEQMMLEAWHYRGRPAKVRETLDSWDWQSLYRTSKEYAVSMGGPKYVEAVWINNGGFPTLESYGHRPPPEEHLRFLINTKLYFETDKYIFAHAGCDRQDRLAETDPFTFLWHPYMCRFRGDGAPLKTVVVGHRVETKPFFAEYWVALDTGCGCGFYLTCADLLTGQVFQEKNEIGETQK
ncbi:MAG: metallophosphoesterase [Deltaproteobacteria bacterium]|nr:metallophosphoesterase [Deltaproteobacteria bacterium]